MRRLVVSLCLMSAVAASAAPRAVQLVGCEGDRLLVRVPTGQGTGGQVVSLVLGERASLSLDGRPAKPSDLWQGDWLSLTTDARGRRVESLTRGACPWAAERAARLKAVPGTLSLSITAAGPTVETATLDAPATARLLDALTADGFLEHAVEGGAPAPTAVALKLTYGTPAASLVQNCVWSTQQRARLTNLAQLASATALTGLLERTAGWPTPEQVRYELLGGYFVSNNFEPRAPTSFVALTNAEALDRVFGVGFVMGDTSHRMDPAAFASRMVLGAVHRGQSLCEYQIRALTCADGVLRLSYDVSAKPVGFECASPLIIDLPKARYKSIEFHESGKLVKTLTPPAS